MRADNVSPVVAGMMLLDISVKVADAVTIVPTVCIQQEWKGRQHGGISLSAMEGTLLIEVTDVIILAVSVCIYIKMCIIIMSNESR